MLSRHNKMLEVQFDKVEHTGQVMDMVRNFEELKAIQMLYLGEKILLSKKALLLCTKYPAAYYARAKEIEMFCKKLESGIDIGKTKHPIYKFRTGQLNVFIELVKELSKLGSRRITVAQMMLAENELDLP